MRALVVCQRDLSGSVLADQLRSWQVLTDLAVTTNDVRLALSRAATTGRPYDVVLVDQDLRDVSGRALCREISAEPSFGMPRRIMIVRDGIEAEAASLDNPYVDAVLTKPLHPTALFGVVAELCGHEHPYARNPKGQTAGGEAAGRVNPLRILLVEDNQVNQKIALAMLVKRGHKVDVANNGIEALLMVSRLGYDLVLMDIQTCLS